jgi:hypothetical protein
MGLNVNGEEHVDVAAAGDQIGWLVHPLAKASL